jgi:ATP-dependent helicase/nuclease subunit A
MTERPVADAAARARALDPAHSFITQAPAGSGKTGLLTQRYLRLLARVEAPEEIIAITFTRKAAGEMQARILEALQAAESDQPPDKPHERLTWECARAALARDRERGWALRANPARLRVQTIDSLCAALARQMPLLSRFGSVPQTLDDATPLYIEAARRTIAELETGERWSDAITHLVKHLDNRLDYLQTLIATMLARREQWLRHVADRHHPSIARDNLEATLARVVEEALAELRERLPRDWQESLLPLARYAAANLPEEDPVAACAGLRWWPAASIDARAQWEGLAELLLTREGEWRKKVDKRHGFPAPGDGVDAGQKSLFKDMKARMGEFLVAARTQEEARAALAELRQLPPDRYSDAEWETLQALFDLLTLSAAQLQLVFQERGQVDFTAMARAAIDALGTDEAPTDLALALDYRIRHLLVDEFQDTSLTQYALLERLTAGWQPGDGRTLFLVGDPMQSIYRFREAEVGLFLKARHQGIGQVALEFLQLTVNFRSQAGVVDWVNQAFPRVLPAVDLVADGAVSYAASTASHAALDGPAVMVLPFFGRQSQAEAERVLALIHAARAEQPAGTLAVLVRGRSHLVDLVAALRQANVRFQAVEIEPLGHRPVIQDLLALTRALEHPADRIAWLALLRAPWCGLSLHDLHALAGADPHGPVPGLLAGHPGCEGLSPDGQARLRRAWPILATALAQRQRVRLRTAVEGTWLSLGGPACLDEATDLQDAEVFFQLLERLEENGHAPDLAVLEQQVARLFALPDVQADAGIQLMTIHKSKGLEFDTVIVPGLGRLPRHDDPSLLSCLERPREPGESDLLLAPIKAAGADGNAIGAYLNRLAARKSRYEDGRLLYVAATRAKRRLHLLGHVKVKDSDAGPELQPPPASTLLGSLWPAVEEEFRAAFAPGDAGAVTSGHTAVVLAPATGIRRLPLDWQRPVPPPALDIPLQARAPEPEEAVEFTWAGEAARHVGTVVHRMLQHSAAGLPDLTAPATQRHYQALARQWLRALGVPGDHLDTAVVKVLEALATVADDTRGRWILDPAHQEARNEYALTGQLDGRFLHVILDRTFIDADGMRWIIDYKTGSHGGGGLEDFLDREQERYRAQLERYALILQALDPRPIRLGLYFPLMAAWREWGFMEPSG